MPLPTWLWKFHLQLCYSIPVIRAEWRAPQDILLTLTFSKLGQSRSLGIVCWEFKIKINITERLDTTNQGNSNNDIDSHYALVYYNHIFVFQWDGKGIPQLGQSQFPAAQTGFHQMHIHHHQQMYTQCATVLQQPPLFEYPIRKIHKSDSVHHLYFLAHTYPKQDSINLV